MSWMNQLYKTYEANIGKNEDDGIALCPIAHMNANAQIEICVNEEGEFVSAKEVDKENAVTLIPVTEASSGRSSGAAPHALCDTLSYVAGDFAEYCQSDKDKKKSEEKFEKYMKGLQQWYGSEYTHTKVKAICTYLQKKCLIFDLIASNIVELGDDNFFAARKVSGQPYDKALVRFRVFEKNAENNDKVWEDKTLIQAYTNYYLSQQNGKSDICYLNGADNIISINHPKGIVAANYGAKLVSANDSQGYTYRGRFQTAEQAFSLSYEASQKIHSALTWLAKKQGVYSGSQDKRIFICWNPNGKKTPNILDLFSGMEDESDIGSNDSYRKKLKNMFRGYTDKYDDKDDIIVISLDAATTGRLSVTYYNELSANDFWKRAIDWGSTCNWLFPSFKEDKKLYFDTHTPSFYRIVQCAFGREKGERIDIEDKVLKEQNQRLLKCMLDGQLFPTDIMRALVNRASTPLAYSKNNRERVLSVACAAIMKYYYDYGILTKGEEYMKLDMENRDRSYLFGRLLAVFERVERSTYDREEGREPNAIRLQSAYVNHPMQTWKILDSVLNPYFQKLKPGSREYYRRIISEITEKILDEDEQMLNQRLKESYLLGYYLQRAEFNNKKSNNKEEESNE